MGFGEEAAATAKRVGKEGKRLFKTRKRTVAFSVLVVLLAGGFFLYCSDWFLFDFADSVNEKTLNVAAVGHFRHSLLKLGDGFNLFRASAFAQDFGLPEYDFEFSGNDLKFFQEASQDSVASGYRPESAQDYRKVKLKLNGESYYVKIALQGDTLWNFAGARKSFKVKTADDEYVNGMRRFNLVLPENRGFILCPFVEALAKKLGMFSLHYEMASVRINGMPQGIYLLEEGLDAQHAERNERPGLLVLEVSDNWLADHPVMQSGLSTMWRIIGALPSGSQDYGAGVITGRGHNTPFDLEISNFREIDFEFEQEARGRLYEFLEAVKAGDEERLPEFVDMENASGFLAVQAILGEVHDFTGDNLRIFYDTTSGKFGFVPRSEGSILALQNYRGGLERSLSSFAGESVPLLEYLLKNEELRNKRNEKIYTLLQDKEQVIETFRGLDSEYRPMLMSDGTSWLSSRETAYYLNRHFADLQGNLAAWEKQLAYGKVYVNAVKEGSLLKLEVLPDSTTALRFRQFPISFVFEDAPDLAGATGPVAAGERDAGGKEAILRAFDGNGRIVFEESTEIGSSFDAAGFLNSNILQANLGGGMEPVKTVFRYEVAFPEGTEFSVSFGSVSAESAITGRLFPGGDIYVGIASGSSGLAGSEKLSLDASLEKYPELPFEASGNTIMLGPGVYDVERDIIIPEGLRVVVGEGAFIRIGPGKSVVSYGDVEINGSEENPVVVSRLNPDKAFGVFGVVGTGGKSKSVARHLEISGGNQAFVNGIFFSGQLSVYHSDFEIFDSRVMLSSSDDGLNVKYGKVEIGNVEFADNFGDQADLDFCDGVVSKSSFLSLGQNSNGDGLDISGSSIIVAESDFRGMGDKGISVGEGSWVLALGNSIADNNMGSAVKDRSVAFFVKNNFKGNITAIAAYEKKPLFGGAEFYIFDNGFLDNQSGFSIDGKSDYGNISFTDEEWRAFEGMVQKEDLFGLKETLLAKR